MTWHPTRWIVQKFDGGTRLGVAAEIRDDATGEERRHAAWAPLSSAQDYAAADRACRAKVQEWIDAMNAGPAIDRGLPLHTEDVLEGHEMRA